MTSRDLSDRSLDLSTISEGKKPTFVDAAVPISHKIIRSTSIIAFWNNSWTRIDLFFKVVAYTSNI